MTKFVSSFFSHDNLNCKQNRQLMNFSLLTLPDEVIRRIIVGAPELSILNRKLYRIGSDISLGSNLYSPKSIINNHDEDYCNVTSYHYFLYNIIRLNRKQKFTTTLITFIHSICYSIFNIPFN